MASHVFSEIGLELTRRHEGLRLAAYQDQAGVWTIGYGHTGAEVHPALTITKDKADAFLKRDLAVAVACVNRLVTVAISQNQFDALVDFAFNLGCGSLRNSKLLRLVNAEDFSSAVEQFQLWDHAGGVEIPGLLARRQAEATLFRS